MADNDHEGDYSNYSRTWEASEISSYFVLYSFLMAVVLVLSKFLHDHQVKHTAQQREQQKQGVFRPKSTTPAFLLSLLPEAGLILIVGMVAGSIVNAFFIGPPEPADYDEYNDNGEYTGSSVAKSLLSFSPTDFFLFVLPPIIFNSGYHLRRELFFRHIVPIGLFAVVGTIVSALAIAFFLRLVVNWGWTGEFVPTMTELLTFGALISATDPVTTLSVFQAKRVDPHLFYLVFGESVLNDAVGLVLFKSFAKFVDHKNDAGKVVFGFGEFIFGFLLDALASPILGALCGCATALLFKTIDLRKRRHRLIELSLYVLIMYVPFLLAELLHLSGIVTILFTGMTAKSFVVPNLTEVTADTAESLFRLAAHLAETSIFLELGLSVIGAMRLEGSFQPLFILWSLFACLLARALHVYPITFLYNRSLRKMPPYDHSLPVSAAKQQHTEGGNTGATTPLQAPQPRAEGDVPIPPPAPFGAAGGTSAFSSAMSSAQIIQQQQAATNAEAQHYAQEQQWPQTATALRSPPKPESPMKRSRSKSPPQRSRTRSRTPPTPGDQRQQQEPIIGRHPSMAASPGLENQLSSPSVQLPLPPNISSGTFDNDTAAASRGSTSNMTALAAATANCTDHSYKCGEHATAAAGAAAAVATAAAVKVAAAAAKASQEAATALRQQPSNVSAAESSLTPKQTRDLKISPKAAHMLWFSGLRGAVAYACVRSFPNTFGHADEFVMTTMAIVLVTVFFLGGTTELVLGWLNIDINVNEDAYMEAWHQEREQDGLILQVEDYLNLMVVRKEEADLQQQIAEYQREVSTGSRLVQADEETGHQPMMSPAGVSSFSVGSATTMSQFHRSSFYNHHHREQSAGDFSYHAHHGMPVEMTALAHFYRAEADMGYRSSSGYYRNQLRGKESLFDFGGVAGDSSVD